MSREARIALVASIGWLLVSAYLASWLIEEPGLFVKTDDYAESYLLTGLLPLIVFWVYRFCFGETTGWAVSVAYLLWVMPIVAHSIDHRSLFWPLYELLGLSPFFILPLVPLIYGAFRFIRAGKPAQELPPEH